MIDRRFLCLRPTKGGGGAPLEIPGSSQLEGNAARNSFYSRRGTSARFEVDEDRAHLRDLRVDLFLDPLRGRVDTLER